MKLLLYSFVILFLTSCSNEQKFSCGTEGLILTNNKATLGFYSLQFCEKNGTINMYSTNCKKEATGTSEIFFDTVSYHLRESGTNKVIQCKKLN